MKQPGALIVLFIFVIAVTFALASEQYNSARQLKATLTGSAEVPGPGDADGTGRVTLTLSAGKNQICYELAVSNIGTATAAHIHSGAADAAGPVLVMLKAPENGSVKDCVTLESEKILDMVKNPASYYVNVHNAEFPDGAVRGQLAK
ncbi:MAG TPA: CHRD domain-containing protein [Pyrinomonadaceae bacterium]